MTWFTKIRGWVSLVKVFIARAVGYISIGNIAMVLWLAMNKLKERGLNYSVEAWFVPVMLFGFLLIVVAGWIDRKYGFHRVETEKLFEMNPQMMEILKRVRRIEERLGEKDGKQ